MPQHDDGLIGSLALPTTVPGPVVIRPVVVILAVALVMLHVVGDQVTHREAVVSSNEVDAGGRLTIQVR